MKKSYITGKNHDFYSRGKAMFDQIQPITQGIPQIPQEHSSKRTWVGLTDEEMKELWENKGWYVTMYKAVEAKLKEKNT